MDIVFVSSEVSPFAKTGGLADVSGSLPKALKSMGHNITIMLPRYQQIHGVDYVTDLPVDMDGHLETAIIRRTTLPADKGDPVEVFFIDNYKYFFRPHLYGYPDDGARFNFFCKAALAALPYLKLSPQVIHCNDWQTALIPLFLKVKLTDDPYYNNMGTLLTIHNLQYQGHFDRGILRTLALGDEFFTPEKLEFYGRVNFLKAGLIYADVLNTVSKKYALEIQTPEMGEGLDGVLRTRAKDLYGIINGIDYDEFNPETDPHIKVNYNIDTWEKKRENKTFLQNELDLENKDVPLIGMVTRLVEQKGIDLVGSIADQLASLDVQFVLLGAGEDRYQEMFTKLALKYRRKVAVRIGLDIGLAQRIYAGADFFLMPSRFEPCGLGQLISMRYGTIPIVRATGGLEDTVIDYARDRNNGTGFVFKQYTPESLWQCLNQALKIWSHPAHRERLIKNAMKTDFCWKTSARQYVDLYHRAVANRKQANHLAAAR